MKRFVPGELSIIVVLSLAAICINLFIWIGKIQQTPADHDFIPIHNSLSDYPFYVDVIRQGMSGQLTVYDRFAVEPHSGSLIHALYLGIGWMGGFLRLPDAHIAYHISRYFLGALWMAVIYSFIRVLIKEKNVRIAAYFFALFSSSFPVFTQVNDTWNISWFMTWWSELDPTVRSAFVPHFTVGHIMMVIALVCILGSRDQYIKLKKLLGMFAAFIAAIVHPPSAIQLLLILTLYMLTFRQKHITIMSLIIIIGSILGLVVINGISSIFPWNLPKSFEGWSFAVPLRDYLLALGPVVLFAFSGFLFTYKKRETWLLFFWIITSLVMIPLSKFMPFSPVGFIRDHPVSNIRFLQVALWVPLGILGARGLHGIWRRIGTIWSVCICVLFLLLTFVGYPSTIREQISHRYFSENYNYPAAGYIAAMHALPELVQPEKTVMSLSLAGMTIPMYANRTVYAGQIVYTPHLDDKLKTSWAFYHGDMTECEAYTLLKKSNAGAVLYSFDERNAGSAVNHYPFLTEWKTFGDTIVYTISDYLPANCAL